MKADQIIALSAAIISLIALVFSWISFRNSNIQFQIINQSYLQADMTGNGITIANNDRSIQGIEANDTLFVQGLNCSIALTNIGNIPLKYKVTKYDILINNHLKNSVDIANDNNVGILYPKQLLNFYMRTTPFQDNGQSIRYGNVKLMEITASVMIEYNDLNSSHIKTIDRKLKFIMHDNMMETRYLSFDDKI